MPPASRTSAALAVLVVLAGCGPRPVGDYRAVGGGGPDEFLVLPTRPLEIPADLAALPPPLPGVANRTDPQPEAQAVAALSGSPVAGAGGGGPLVAAVGPAEPGIRARLAREDQAYRARNPGRPLERLVSTNRENLIYGRMQLDEQAEFERLRAQGVQVPAAPEPQ